ncbi:response regulator transcription factor [Streptomyces sp. NBC_01803]|uniref:response regulator transcription factor n=1 Tax=Streptomyces sp. NBC_01803 TaxID=2975946 RepID=UPI002DDC7F1A|nr:response regulator transcription factor [Streptomyces sp. NBC_01803]WSA43593.1 response regulator transcription factor [Streptomyces sp. NBC_01803]
MPPTPTPTPSEGQPIRVVLVEDHDMVAEAIGQALDRAAGMTVVARSRSIAAALADTRHCRPDVVVLDRRLPDGDGIAAIGRLMEAAASARVLVLTGEATASVATRVVEAGGAGLVLKSGRLEELEAAVRQVAAGEVVFAPGLLSGILDRLTGRVPTAGATLTGRERETLLLLAEGLSTAQVGERLGVAHNTARNHVQRVLEKIGARSKLEAVAIARRDGLLD